MQRKKRSQKVANEKKSRLNITKVILLATLSWELSRPLERGSGEPQQVLFVDNCMLGLD